jgi:hypothetical protein
MMAHSNPDKPPTDEDKVAGLVPRISDRENL